MINNRQGGRRRGRGGQRGQSLGGQPGNRQDNRQRGNAAQLLEKYKSLARDAQLAGDRVQTEYYLQYADHYYRVLGESRARFEDQRRQRGEDVEEDEGEEELVEAAEGEAPRGDERQDRGERFNRRDRGPRRFAREEPEEAPIEESAAEDEPRPSGRGNGAGETIPFDALPPAIGREGDEEGDAEPRRPRRRARGPRPAEGEDEVAPAA